MQEKQFSESSTLSLRNQKTARLVALSPEHGKLPGSYTSNSRPEKAMLAHCQAFSDTFLASYPHRPPPFLTPRHACSLSPSMLVCMTDGLLAISQPRRLPRSPSLGYLQQACLTRLSQPCLGC